MIARVRDLDIAVGRVHGGNRRPSRADLDYRIDPAELAAWTARNRRAIAANHERKKREEELDHLEDLRRLS